MKAGAATGDRDATGKDTRNAVIRLVPVAGAAATARHFATAVLKSWRVAEEIVQDVLLAVSELVTNAVEHGAGEIAVELFALVGGDRLRVVVSDEDGDGVPTLVPVTPHSVRSRGLAIVAAVSADWGHSSGPYGKSVWADFDLVAAPSG